MNKTRSLFEYSDKMQKITKMGDPLDRLNKQIPWEQIFKRIFYKINKKEKKSQGQGGRKSYDRIMMLKVLILQRAYNLSDEQTEYQINDRLSFQRFLGLDLSCDVPDYSTIWKFREFLTINNLIEKMFTAFNDYLKTQGLSMNSGSIVDASFVEVPRQRNSKDENDQIKKDQTPSDWSDKKCSHKDIDARWTTKNDEHYYGYKNHVKTDIDTKLITKYTTTSASVHDSQELKNLIGKEDQNKKLYADSAYRSKETELMLAKKNIKSMILEKGHRNNPLTEAQNKSNKRKSKIRVRVEHIFGFIENSMNGSTMRCIGKLRGHNVIGLMNLTYNIFRSMQLQSI